MVKLLLLAAALPLVGPALAACPAPKQTCTITPKRPQPAGLTCGTRGTITERLGREAVLQNQCTGSYEGCRELCRETEGCLSFRYNIQQQRCTLYSKKAAALGFDKDASTPTTFTDKACFTYTSCTPTGGGGGSSGPQAFKIRLLQPDGSEAGYVSADNGQGSRIGTAATARPFTIGEFMFLRSNDTDDIAGVKGYNAETNPVDCPLLADGGAGKCSVTYSGDRGPLNCDFGARTVFMSCKQGFDSTSTVRILYAGTSLDARCNKVTLQAVKIFS